MTEPVRGFIDFANTGRAIIAEGSFETTARLECSRCLSDFTVPVSSAIDEQFEIPVVAADLSDGEEEAEPEFAEELEPIFVENTLDLTELIRQTVILALPIRPLCGEACRGLCPTCGQNLNERDCGCERGEGPRPFANLAEMIKTKQKDVES